MTQTHASNHQSALAQKHADLEAQIALEAGTLAPDAMKLQALKKQKLAVKDALQA